MNDQDSFAAFERDVEPIWQLSRGAWATVMLERGRMNREELAMVTLQMYHYVKDTVPVLHYALARLPAGAEHDDYRRLLEHFVEEEAGHDRVALRDLAALGYDAEACAATFPLPTTMALQGANRLAIDAYGPYFLLGETYATETTGARISAAIHRAYVAQLGNATKFYDVHGEADVDHAARSEACLRRYLPEHRRVLTLGCITAWRNLMGMATEVQNYRLYPEPFQLVAR